MTLPDFTSRTLRVLLIGALLLLAGTALAAGSPAVYKVRRGDNLSVIGARFGVTVKDLKQANGLASDLLSIGQELKIERPFRRTKGGDVRWIRPSNRLGRELRSFGPYKKGSVLMPSTGVGLACPVGTKLVAPANGVVRHVGPMDGFGLLVILEHGGGYATVMAPLDPERLTVRPGQAILRGAPVGRTGPPSGEGEEPYLHLELRRNDKAIKPDRLYK